MTLQLVGADPELFVRDIDTKEVLSAIGLLGGTKDTPREVPYGAVQEDNVLAEFNIIPAATADEFYKNIKAVMDFLRKDLAKHNLEPYRAASHVYTKPYLKGLGGQAFRFGCEPDLNAWTGEENPKPNAYTCLRSAGGHIHISYTNPSVERSFNIVKAFELMTGIPMLFRDPDTQRRELYGKSGACRIKPYGVEIRSPSNFWLQSRESIKSMFYAAHRAEKLADNIDAILDETGLSGNIIQDVINNTKLAEAEFILNKIEAYR